MDFTRIAKACRVKENEKAKSRFWSQIGFVFYRIIQTAAEENWVCYVRAKFAAEVGTATVSKHRERHRGRGGDSRVLTVSEHQNRRGSGEVVSRRCCCHLVAMYSYWKWRDSPFLW